MKTISLKILIGIAALAVTLPAQATIVVSLEPGSQTISVGDPVSMDLVISGLGDHASPSVGGFGFDLSYNPAILSALSVEFGSQLDLGVGGSSSFSDLTKAGAIHLDEISFESAADLNAAQPASFTLATLSFQGVGAGLTMFNFTGGSVSDETGGLSLPFSTVGGQIQVTSVAPIPEVGTSMMGLLLVGLLGLERCRRTPHHQ